MYVFVKQVYQFSPFQRNFHIYSYVRVHIVYEFNQFHAFQKFWNINYVTSVLSFRFWINECVSVKRGICLVF